VLIQPRHDLDEVAGPRPVIKLGREENRDAFAAAPERFLREAKLRWPTLEQGLAQ